MTFSPLTARIVSSPQRGSRLGATVDHILYHHQAGTDSEAVLRAMQNGTRQVSSNYVITNEGEIVGVVDEGDRAWTSGSAYDGGKGADWDRRSITMEIENSASGGSWPVSAKAEAAVARLSADIARRYKFTLSYGSSSSSTFGHRDLWNYFQASYPTACPGGLDIPGIIRAANSSEDTMKLVIANSDAAATATAPAIVKDQRYLVGEFTARPVGQTTFNAVYGPAESIEGTGVQRLYEDVAARRATLPAVAGTDLTPILTALTALQASLQTKIAAVPAATRAAIVK